MVHCPKTISEPPEGNIGPKGNRDSPRVMLSFSRRGNRLDMAKQTSVVRKGSDHLGALLPVIEVVPSCMAGTISQASQRGLRLIVYEVRER